MAINVGIIIRKTAVLPTMKKRDRKATSNFTYLSIPSTCVTTFTLQLGTTTICTLQQKIYIIDFQHLPCENFINEICHV